ncbi:MAG: HIT family protein [Phycisphaerae bacterium]
MADAASESIFTKIIRGEIPCHGVFENDHMLALLDITPLSEGHTLVVPKRQVERLEDLPPDEVAEIARHLGAIARRVLAVTGAEGYNVLQNNGKVAGQEVPHVHFHIIPRRAGDGLGYRWNAKPAAPEALADLAKRINAADA